MVKRVSLLAWGLWTAFVLTVAAATYFGFNPPAGPPIRLVDAIWAASFIGFPTAGALIVPRMPQRPLGWILLLAPLLLMIGVTISDAVRYVDETPTAARWSLWVASLCFGAGLAPLVMVPLYLPDGRLPSPRWRGAARAAWGIAVVTLLHAAFKPGPLEASNSPIRNPLGIEALRPVFEAIEAAMGPMLLATIAVGFLSLVVRFRTAHGTERQQMKWLALGGAGVLTPFGLITSIEALFFDLSDVAVTLFIVVAILSLPLSIAVAVLKTRLYEIDVVINRALVYGALTGILALAYLGLVVVFQRVLEPITRESDLAIAGSTLAVAALFRPLRARVQGFIDRRFYRRKYDAAETLGAFSSKLRDQVDLESLKRELVGVVHATVQPRHASLWLKSPGVDR